MAKYIIHACPQRMWYVNDYLIPSMQEQGIEDIVVECDEEQLGNLEKCMQIFSNMNGYGSAWHIQDDVVICHDFRERTEQYSPQLVVCGFAYKLDENYNWVGETSPQHMWWSFPCIHIPNRLAKSCADWYYGQASHDLKYKSWWKENKYDDAFFKEFLVTLRPNTEVINVKPNLVDHIDWLIGGTTINKERNDKCVSAGYFTDHYLINDLTRKIRSGSRQ